jgi:undecaprenyl-diphosphatase
MSDESKQAASTNALVTQAGVLLVAAGLFGLLARRVATGDTKPFDEEARRWTQDRRTTSLDVAVKPIALMSLPVLVVSATLSLAWWLERQQRRGAALAVAITPLVAAVAGQSFTTFLPQRNAPDADSGPNGEIVEPCFPSGHTTGAAAEALAIGYVLAREELLPIPAVAALAAWPVLIGVARIYRDRHWTTDIIAGLAAGTAVAAATSMLYETARSA